jgi:hypothetical protein
VVCNPGFVTGATCETEACDYASCTAGHADCDDIRQNGCERDLTVLPCVFVFNATNPLASFSFEYSTAPALADLDDDGDFELIVGRGDGTLRYFRNDGSPQAPAFVELVGAENPVGAVAVGFSSTPAIVDIDGDGDRDLFVGALSGTLNYFRNEGSAASPTFVEQMAASNPLSAVAVASHSKPAFADIDGDGDGDAFVASNSGSVYFYRNIGTALAAEFQDQTGTTPVPFNNGTFTAPAFTDIDGDGDLDAFFGGNDGTISHAMNAGSSQSPSLMPASGANNPFNTYDVGTSSTPAFADIDGDGDQDAFVGEYGQALNYLRHY